MSKIALVFLPFLFVSCATITRGVHDKLYVNSEPSGAQVQLSTGEHGVTPAKFIESRKKDVTVTVSKSGYVSQTVKVESKFSATGGTAMAGNVVAGGVLGIGIDAVSGATSGLYPNPVEVKLVPSKKTKSETKTKKRTTTTSSKKKLPGKIIGTDAVEMPEIKSSPAQAPPAQEPSPVLQSSPSP